MPTRPQLVVLLDQLQYASVVALAFVLPLSQAFTMAAVVASIVFWLVGALVGPRRLCPPTRLNWLMLAWLVSVLLSCLNTTDAVESLDGVRKFLMRAALFYVVVGAVTTPARIQGVLTAASAGLALIIEVTCTHPWFRLDTQHVQEQPN